MGLTRFELVTPRLSSVCSNQLSYRPRYSLTRFLIVDCKLLIRNQQSAFTNQQFQRTMAGSLKTRQACNSQSPECQIDLRLSKGAWLSPCALEFSRKEVIQPQVLLQLPCYDFTPITDHTLGASLPCGLVWRLLVQPAFVM